MSFSIIRIQTLPALVMLPQHELNSGGCRILERGVPVAKAIGFDAVGGKCREAVDLGGSGGMPPIIFFMFWLL